MINAGIFDLDGTLLDSNSLHVQAWQNAFHDHDFRVTDARIEAEVGKGGDQLVPAIIGQVDDDTSQKLRDAYAKHIAEILKTADIAVINGARELLHELQKRGLRLALATSSKSDFLEQMERASDWPFRQEFEVVTTSDDAPSSKPAPDIIGAVIEKLQLSPAQCTLIGDTPFDAQAARLGGVSCLGVLSSKMGVQADVLQSAGARAIYDNCEDIMRHLDEALHIASPLQISLTTEKSRALMNVALECAREGMSRGEVPIGSVLADGTGAIVARGWNQMNKTQCKTAHAEMQCFADSAGKVALDARDLILVTTLEPCVMCTGAAMESAVETILYALEAPPDSGTARVSCPRSPESQMPRIIGGIWRDESRALFEEWLHANENTAQDKFVRGLLDATA